MSNKIRKGDRLLVLFCDMHKLKLVPSCPYCCFVGTCIVADDVASELVHYYFNNELLFFLLTEVVKVNEQT